MDIDNSKTISDIYAIYRSKYPASKADPDAERKILDQIQVALDTSASSIKDEKLREVFILYFDNLEDFKRTGGIGSASTVEAQAASVGAFFRTQAQESRRGFFDDIADYFKTGWKDFISSIEEGNKEGRDQFFSGLVSAGYLTKDGADFLNGLFDKSTLVGLSGGIASIIMIITSYMRVATGTMSGNFVKNMQAKFTPNYLDPSTLISALHRAPELADSINKKLSENGLSGEDINLLKVSNYSLYDVEQTRICYLRGIISKQEMSNRLGELGFTPKRIDEIVSTWNVIPGPQDLFWLVGKEAFEPEQIAKFGLSAEYPEEQTKWLEMQGISAEWAMKYWIAHWDYPSEGRVLDLYHRGIIDDDALDQFYKVIEIPPYWREKLKKASYSLYTRVDLRRMHDLGLINEQDVYDNFRSDGYDDIHAKNMTKFYLQYNEDNNKDLTRSQIENAYKADLITKVQAIEMLEKLKYTKDQSTFMVELVDYNETIEMQKIRIKTVQKSYKNYDITEQESRRLLSQLNVETKWIDFYIQTWDAEKELEEKIPPKEDLIDWYQNGLLSEADFILYMRKHRYSDKTIQIYLKSISGS